MQKRFLPFITTIGGILAVAVLLWGFLPPKTDASSIENTINGQTTFVPVTGAGTVILLRSDDELEVKSAIPFNGYSYDIEIGKGRLVRVLFRGENRQVLFTAIFDNGEVRVTSTVLGMDPGELAGDSTTTVTVAPTTTIAPVVTTPAPAAPPTTKTPTTTNTTAAPATTAATTTVPPTTTTVAPTTTTVPPTTTTAVSAIPDGIVTYSLGPAGTITVTFLKQKFVEGVVDAASGWSVDKADGDSNDIQVELVSDDLRTIWEARIQNGRVFIDLRTVQDD